MRQSLFRITLVLSVLVVAGCATSKVGAQDIAGDYTLAGETPGGDPYQGSLQLKPEGSGFDVDWQGRPGLERHGYGLRLDQVLGIVAEDQDPYLGVVLYRVKGGHLEGVWRYAGGGSGLGTEDLDGPPGLDGEYKITLGRNPEGSRYHGSVTIRKSGDIYLVDWRTPKPSYVGTGVLLGDIFVVGYSSGRRSGVAAYCLQSTAALDGIVGESSDTRVGAEMLRRGDAKIPDDARTRLEGLRLGGARTCNPGPVADDDARPASPVALAAR